MKKTSTQDTPSKAGYLNHQTLKVFIAIIFMVGFGGSYLAYTFMYMPEETKPTLEPNVEQKNKNDRKHQEKNSTPASNAFKDHQKSTVSKRPNWSELFGTEQEYKQIAILKTEINALQNIKTYIGALGTHIASLEKKLKSMSLQLSTLNGLPSVQAYQSKLHFQVIDGYVLGADLKFESGFSGADWDMINQILCSGAEYQGDDDPMMFMDEILSKPNSERSSYQGTWLIKDQANANTKIALKINYQIQIDPKEQSNSARFWLSSDL